jgi:hypothetical protein
MHYSASWKEQERRTQARRPIAESSPPSASMDAVCTNVLCFDGQRWDISNLRASAKLSECQSLYPKILSDEEDLFYEIDKKRNTDIHGSTTQKKMRAPPTNMTLKQQYNTEENDGKQHSGTQEARTVATESDSDTNSLIDDDNEEKLMLEIASGLEVQLRGSLETRRAIQNWEIIRVDCLECTVQLHCIEDAEYLLCPLCRCISPLSISRQLKSTAYGVGLGFQSCPRSGRKRRQSPSHVR